MALRDFSSHLLGTLRPAPSPDEPSEDERPHRKKSHPSKLTHHLIYFKYLTILCVNYTPLKLEKNTQRKKSHLTWGPWYMTEATCYSIQPQPGLQLTAAEWESTEGPAETTVASTQQWANKMGYAEPLSFRVTCYTTITDIYIFCLKKESINTKHGRLLSR